MLKQLPMYTLTQVFIANWISNLRQINTATAKIMIWQLEIAFRLQPIFNNLAEERQKLYVETIYSRNTLPHETKKRTSK